MSLPKITVLIPAYQAGNFIVRALDSVAEQSYTNYEVIVVNDGSRDNTSKLVKEHKLDVTLIEQINEGVSAARNAGIKAARGKYIAFLDADDEWRKSKLEIQIKAMELNGWLTSYTKNPKEMPLKGQMYTSKNLEEIFMKPYLVTSTVVVKTDVIKEIGGFDTLLKTAEDIDLYLKLALKGEIGEINEKLLTRHILESGLSSQLSSYRDNLYVIDRFYQQHRHIFSDKFKHIYKDMQTYILNEWAKDLIWRDKPVEAFPVIIESLNVCLSSLAFKLLIKCAMKSTFGWIRLEKR